MTTAQQTGAWLTHASFHTAEIIASLDYDFVVLDVEHGTFDLGALNRITPFVRALGLPVYSKVFAPTRAGVQQALDLGADGVILPHIRGVEHAREIASYTKFAPLGDRSVAGGRTMGYDAFDDAWLARQNTTTQCIPMVESAEALEDIEAILALDTVDGVFIGPSDLALRRGRGAYTFSAGDRADIERVADAADAVGKPWMFPAWTAPEVEFAVRRRAPRVLLTMEEIAIAVGFEAGRATYDAARAAVGTA